MMNILTTMKSQMPHRERVAWLSLLAMAFTFGPYFTLTAISPPTEPLPDLPAMLRFGVAVSAQMLILGVGHLWLRIRSPWDARAPADERDRTIARRSHSVAYCVLIVGMIVVGVVMPFNSGGWKLINAAIMAIVVAEVVHYGVAVWGYRRGWHD